MAHEIYTTAAGKASMAFVGQTPWHGLGQALTLGASVEEWRVEAGLDWHAESAPVMFERADGSTQVYGDKRVIYRADTGAALSVMGDGYQIVQPGECLEFFRDLVEGGGWHLHTAGTLDGGRKIWAMASRDDLAAEVVPGDRVTGNLLIATSLDGSAATCAGLTNVRVVCANTFGQALRGKLKGARGGAGVKVTHRSTFDAVEVKRQLGIASDTFAAQMETMRKLAASKIGTDEARDLLREVFGQPKVRIDASAIAAAQASQAIAAARGDSLADLLQGVHVPKDHGAADREARELLASAIAGADVREQKSVARCLELFAGAGRGANHEGVAGTKWGLFNAITEHVDHEQGRAIDTRLQSAWFGRGADFKQDALALLTA